MSETVIGPTLTIDGEVSGDDALSIHGVVRGTINVRDAVFVSADGRVEADIDSLDVEIAGAVEGNVAASEKIEIKSGGQLVGDVHAPRVLIADGASFKGNINMQG